MKRILLFAVSMLFICSGEAATSGGKGKLGSVADSGHGGTGGGGSSTGRTMVRDPRKAPPLEESRKVNEQDCSKAVDLSAGNLRCK